MDYRNRVQMFLDVVNAVYQGDAEFPEPVEITESGKILSNHWIGAYDESDSEDIEADALEMPRTEEEFKSTCIEILKRVFEFPLAYQKERYTQYQLLRYAQEFAKQVKSEWKCLKDAPIELMRVNFPTRSGLKEDGTLDYSISGECFGVDDLTINIFGVYSDHIEQNKKTVRHEVLHWLLKVCGLPYTDDSFAFWVFCHIYDAGAYEEMNTENKNVFDYIMQNYKTDPEQTKHNLDAAFVNLRSNVIPGQLSIFDLDGIDPEE